MKTSEQILAEIRSTMELNKNIRAKCNTALSDAISLIQHNEKEMKERLDEEYKRGMNDAWEIAREVINMEDEEFDNIFDELLSPRYVITNNVPLQVKEKISTFRQEKENELNTIHVGDVVQNMSDATRATILDRELSPTPGTHLDKKYWMVFTENGYVECWHEDNFFKTGESVDICSALIK